MFALSLSIFGCGGGGGGGSFTADSETNEQQTNRMVTGVAATGGPVSGVILLKDSSTPPVQLTATTNSDGSFSFNTVGMKLPFMLKTTVAAVNLYSIAAETGINNLTPLTTIAVAQASGGADLDALYNKHVQSEITAAALRMPEAVNAVQKYLAPLMEKFGVTSNILTSQFNANHTGVDALLDAISVVISGGKVSITNNQNGALFFSAPSSNLSAGNIVTANIPSPLSTPAPLSGTALYASQCAGCHGPLATSGKKDVTVVRLQNAISGGVGGMNVLARLTNAELQAIVTALSSSGGQTGPVPTPTPDGAALYASNCAGCHGALANSTKQGITNARLQSAIANKIGGMGSLSSLTVTEVQAIVTALTPATPTPIPTPVVDGKALYAANCAACHGALAASGKAGATASRIQGAIGGNAGGMGSLSILTPVQVSAIATALAGVTPSPTPTPACGSCHAIPPATGRHSTHGSKGVSCSSCHGSGYSATTVNAATHSNGIKDLTASIGWNAASSSCTNSCHGKHTW
jgi:mono/diheme cytochrome c family protein